MSRYPREGNLICPLCQDKLTYVGAYTCNSGSYRPAYVSCPCGFSWRPKKDVSVNKGESGWDAIYRHKAETDEEIKSKFISMESR